MHKNKLSTCALILTATLFTAGCSFSILPPLELPAEAADVNFVQKAIHQNPENAHAWFILGKERLQVGDSEKARDAFRQALDYQPNFPEAQIGIGKSYLQQREWTNASRAFQSVLENNNNSISAYEGLAEAHYGSDNLEAAKEAASEALRLSPNSFTGLMIAGNVAYIGGHYTQALQYWRQATPHGELPSDIRAVMLDLEPYIGKYSE